MEKRLKKCPKQKIGFGGVNAYWVGPGLSDPLPLDEREGRDPALHQFEVKVMRANKGGDVADWKADR